METGKVMPPAAGLSSGRGRRRPRLAATVAALLCAATAPPLVAQEAACPAGRIAYIYIDAQPIFDADDPGLDGRLRWAYNAANALHVTTAEPTLRRELLIAPGDCYDPFLLAESERLLRNYGVFARVDVFGVPQPDGDWHVIVATRDEWSTQLDVRFRFDNGVQFEGVRLYETNLLGRARTFGAFYYERDVTRDYGLVYATPQMFRSRWDGSVAVGRTRAGTFLRSEIAYPFLGEIGQLAGRIAYRREDQFFDYVIRDDAQLLSPHVLQPMRAKYLDASAVRRFGERGRTFMLGAAVTWEEISFPGPTQVAPPDAFDERTPATPEQRETVVPQLVERDQLRVSFLVGVQNIEWRKRRGLDTMRGEQDIRSGTEVGLVLGRTVGNPRGGDDLLVAGTAYAGFRAFGGFWALRARADGRRGLHDVGEREEWDDVAAEAEMLAYFRYAAFPNHTLVFRAAGVGGWSTRHPFQLTLGGERALRGYDLERFPGGRRFVFTVEDRIYLGWPWPDLFDTGLTLFAETGRVWPGDAPFGVDSGWRGSAGFGIRSSFPAGGRTTYRLDFAWPVDGATRLSDVSLRISIGEIIGLAQREPDPQLSRSRIESIGGRLFDVRNR